MGEDLKNYSIQLLNDIPYEMYAAMLIAFFVGVLVLIGSYGFRKGVSYSLKLLIVEYACLLYSSTVIFRPAMSVRFYDFTPFWSYRAIMDGSEPQLLSENFMNVMVFVPVGLLAGFAFRGVNWMRTLAIGGCLSIGIEFLQLLYRKGLSEFDDVMHNTVGCLMGYWMYMMILRTWRLVTDKVMIVTKGDSAV